MTSVVTSAGSPLDDYFKDEGEGQTGGPSLASESYGMDGTSDEGDVTLVSSSTSPDLDNTRRSSSTLVGSLEKGWTGVIESVAGPSRHPSPTLPGHFDLSSGQIRVDDEFAERFKYIICSSGILEKDYVPGLAGTTDDLDPQAISRELQSTSPERRDLFHRLRRAVDSSRHFLAIAKERWDILLAVAVLLAGLVRISGLKTMAWILLVLCAAWGLKTLSSTVAEAASSRDTSRAGVLSAVASFLATSRQVDTTFDETFSLLNVSPSDDERHHDLRLALHRAIINLVDHFATATSGLSTLINHSELSVLAEMYDVAVVPTTRTRPTHRESEEDEDPQSFNLSLDSEATFFDPSKRLRVKKAARSRYTSTSMSLTQSSPGRIKHMRHLSLASSATLSRTRSNPNSPMNWTPRDRFTSLPPRTPRESKRISLDPAMWERIRRASDEGVDEADDSLSPSRLLESFPDIPEGDGGADAPVATKAKRASLQAGEQLGPFESSLASPTSVPHRYSPFQTSPLATHPRSPHSNVTSPLIPSISTQLLPTRSRYSLPATSTGSKRSSLQNMPYYSDDQRSPTKSIARMRTRPNSELQELRTRSSGGFHRSSGSISGPRTAPIGLGIPGQIRPSPIVPTPPRHKRTTSINPLSSTSLKASCLNVHLKRRRLACCLLGLRFDERHSVYWEEVCAVTISLYSAVGAELDTLHSAIEVAKEYSTEPVVDEPTRSPLFNATPTLDFVTDFAPRQAPEDILLEHIEAIRGQLAALWGAVDDLRTRLHSGDELGDRWTTMRESLREMTREWEKGRRVASRLEPNSAPSRPTSPSEESAEPPNRFTIAPSLIRPTEAEDVPAFLRSWSNESSSSEANEADEDNTTPPTGSDGDPELPLPGIDQVFESDLSAMPARPVSTLTREERIKLVKEARARGLNVSRPLRAVETDDDAEAAVATHSNSEEAVVRGGEVVEELKGMIGMIRKRKGLDVLDPSSTNLRATGDQSTGVPPPGDVRIPPVDSIKDRHIEADVDDGSHLGATPTNTSHALFPSEDLRKAFVFPVLERRPTE